jgi:hypothetical protein
MVVGCKEIDFAALKQACQSEEALVKFAVHLVPSPLRHIPAIISNQKYLVALQVRTIQSLPWQRRKSLCEYLLQDVVVKGIVDSIYDYNDLLMAIDCAAFQKYLEEEEKRDAEK